MQRVALLLRHRKNDFRSIPKSTLSFIYKDVAAIYSCGILLLAFSLSAGVQVLFDLFIHCIELNTLLKTLLRGVLDQRVTIGYPNVIFR